MFCRLKNQTRSQFLLPLWPKLYEPNELHIYFWKLNTMSGWAHWASNPQKCEPSRPQPVCTSSAFLRAFLLTGGANLQCIILHDFESTIIKQYLLTNHLFCFHFLVFHFLVNNVTLTVFRTVIRTKIDIKMNFITTTAN